MGKKRIQVTSDFKADTEQFYERVHHHNSGETKVVENTKPHLGSSSITITTNPYTVETAGSTEEARTKEGSSSTVNINKPGYDTSQL
jgi:hypothetical protein